MIDSLPARVVMRARALVKHYGDVAALDGTDFELRAGEILAIVGDNGAGKSSLVKALSGALVLDSGEIEVDGAAIRLRSPADARQAGIGTLYQDPAVAPAKTIARNLFLGRELHGPGWRGRLMRTMDEQRMIEDSAVRLAELKLRIGPTSTVLETLTGGERECIAIARAATFARKVVILDEPTTARGVKDAGFVLDLIRRVRDRGLAVVLVSHDLSHVFALADRIHVTRMGRRAAVLNPREVSVADTIAVMTGALQPQDLPPQALAH